jgi:hypothetical protein
LDVAKAFDSLNHSILLGKLEIYGVRGVVLQWFSSYLSNRFQYIEFDGKLSTYKLIKSSIPQGR